MSSFEVKVYRIQVEPHPNADRLEIGRIEGQDYQFIVGKDQFKSGDLFAYIPEQAIVPAWILEEMNLVGKLNGTDRNRVKAQKFRGILSQGLAYEPPAIAAAKRGQYWRNEGDEWYAAFPTRVPVSPESIWIPWVEGADIGEALGIVKYEPHVPARMAGIWKPAPNHTPIKGGALWQGYTSLENIKKVNNAFEEGEPVVFTEKLHGTCLNVLWREGELFVSSLGVARRGFVLQEDEDNVYWKVARQYHLEAFLALVAHRHNVQQLMLFGEIVGVQDLKYGLVNGALAFYAFDLLLPSATPPGHYWLDHQAFEETCALAELPTVPVLYTGPFSKGVLADYTSGQSVVPGAGHLREGVVVRPVVERYHPHHGRVVLKSISGEYLIRAGETTEFN